MIKLNLEHLLLPTAFLDLKYKYIATKTMESLQEKYSDSKLAFLDVDKNKDIEKILDFAKRAEKYEDIVILGIGGSALGTRAIMQAVKGKYYNMLPRAKRNNCPRLHILDNVDPKEVGELLEVIDMKNTLFMVISKSGGTLETVAQYAFFKEKYCKEISEKFQDNFVVIAGENSTFKERCLNEGLDVFDIPEGIGGRFSALTNVGLLPLACIGIDIEGLLTGVTKIRDELLDSDMFANKALLTSIIQYHSYIELGKNITVFFPYIANFGIFGQWYKQMIGESLGKGGTGVTLSDAVGVTDQHSQLQLYYDGPNDKLVMFLECEDFGNDYKVSNKDEFSFADLMSDSKYGTEQSLSNYNKINYTIKIENLKEESLGELILFFEMQTAILGELYGFDPFDQPGVEIGKKITKQKLRDNFGKINIL